MKGRQRTWPGTGTTQGPAPFQSPVFFDILSLEEGQVQNRKGNKL